MTFEYIYHPVNNHQYLDFGDEYKWRKLDFAAKNMEILAKIEQTTTRRPAIIDWACFETNEG